MDFESGEQVFIRGPRVRPERTHTIIDELHLEIVNCEHLVKILEREDFTFIPANSVFLGNMTAFVIEPPARL